MKTTATFVNYSNEGALQIKGYNEKEPNKPFNLELKHDSSNCKLSYLHQIGNLNNLSTNQKKIIIDTALMYCKGCVILNTNNKAQSDFIKENYDVYYYHKVPIGYYDGYQYHIAIRNNISPNAHCKKPEKNTDLLVEVQVEPLKDDFKTFIKDKLLTILKSKRRKSDFIDEFLNTL